MSIVSWICSLWKAIFSTMWPCEATRYSWLSYIFFFCISILSFYLAWFFLNFVLAPFISLNQC